MKSCAVRCVEGEMSDQIIAGHSPFKSTNYRPSTFAGRVMNGETPMSAKKPDTGILKTPVPPAPNGKIRNAMGELVDPAPPPTTKVTEVPFDDGLPPVKLSDVLDGLSNAEFNASQSKSPDEEDSHMAESQSDVVQLEPVKTGEPPHWMEIEGQVAIFNKFAEVWIKDFALMDRKEPDGFIDWTVPAFLIKYGIAPATIPTLGEAKNKFYEVAFKAFKDDIKAIMNEKGYPIEHDTIMKILKFETIADAMLPTKGGMSAKGVREAITGHVTSWWNERNLAQNNTRIQQRNQAEQAAPAVVEIVSTPTPKPEPKIEDAQVIDIPSVDAPAERALSIFKPSLSIARAKVNSDIVNTLRREGVLKIDKDFGKVPGTDKETLLKPGAEKLCSAFRYRPEFVALDKEITWDSSTPRVFYRYECRLFEIETGFSVATAIGSCSSMEKKYRWRWVDPEDVEPTLDLARLKSRTTIKSEFTFAVEKAETTGKYGKPAEYWQEFNDAITNKTAVKTTKETPNYKGAAWEIVRKQYRVPNDEVFDLINTIDKMAQKRALVAATLIGCNASEFFTQDVEDFGTIDAEVVVA